MLGLEQALFGFEPGLLEALKKVPEVDLVILSGGAEHEDVVEVGEGVVSA